MSKNSHYYSKTEGRVIERPLVDPQAKAGSSAGRKQRNKDREREVYPRQGLPISRKGRSNVWIEHYQRGYYQAKTTGRPMLGDEPVITISVSCDRRLLEELDLAGIGRSDAFVRGANVLLDQIKPPK
ncbi:MAG: hypothetical protein HC852_02815 [Acaryochloridaceae cyanobacterium RU_4_10]|nr:hypothetical protein [Acaryochloridaceae cyanobacterium RU_4_10]